MGLQNNTPTVTWLSITGTTITYNNDIYSVRDVKTDKEYIYWESTNPYMFRVANDDLGVSGTRYLVFKNNRGEGIKVPNDSILVTFDGNTSKIAEDEIFGLIEKTGEHDGKFVNVIKDIDGIEQTVGAWSETNIGTITESVSSIKQDIQGIDLTVKETTKQFNENTLRDNVNKSLIEFNAEIGLLSSNFYTYSDDSVISVEETTYINNQLVVIDSKIAEVNTRINEVIDLANTEGQIIEKDAIISEKDKLNITYTNLKNYISSAISDGVTTPTDITGIVNLLSKCNTDVNTLKNTVDDFIILGSGGRIVEEFAKIGIKSNEIVLEVSKKVNNDDIISSINISNEAIKIRASKVDITGLVTFSDLSGNGTTTINGANIVSGTISADKISGGILKAMDKIEFGANCEVTKRADHLGSYSGMKISGALIEISAPVIDFSYPGTTSFRKIEPEEISIRLNGGNEESFSVANDGSFYIRPFQHYNQYSNAYVSAFNVSSAGNCAVAYDFWADRFMSRINGDVSVASISENDNHIESRIIDEDFCHMEDGVFGIDLTKATMSLYEKNKELELENLTLKLIQSEQDEFLVENAYNLALVKLT